MITIQQAIGQIIKSKPFLEEAIDGGLINLSSLARKLIPEVEGVLMKPVKQGAIVMALKRHQPGRLAAINIKAGSLLNNLSNIIVRSNISVFTFENSPSLYGNITDLAKGLQEQKGLFFTFSYGIFETTIIVNSRVEEQIIEKLKGENKLAFHSHLSCITLYLPDENTEIAGYYYLILKILAWEGINIVEVLSTTNEFSLIIEEKNVDKAFSVLKRGQVQG
jgi:hypothetical protein